MKPSIIIIFTVVILLSSFAVLGAFWFFDHMPLVKKTSEIEIFGNKASSSPPLPPPESFSPQGQPPLPKKLSWVEVISAAPWEARDSGAVFVYQNKLWLMGGLNANNTKNGKIVEYWKAPHFNDIWNTEDGLTWRLATVSSAWDPRRSMSVVFFDNKLWMLGGWSPTTGYTNDIWNSKDGIHWTKVVDNASFPPAEGQIVVVFKNKLWKIGGVDYNERQEKNDVWYSENGIDWIKAENIPWEPRWDHAVAVFKGKMFLAGGMNLHGKIFSDIWVSENGLNWKLITTKAPWGPRQGHALEVYQDKLWLIGGLDNQEGKSRNDIWFSDDGVTWQKTDNDPSWAAREDFFSAVFKNKIWVFGGMNVNQQWLNDVWVSAYPK